MIKTLKTTIKNTFFDKLDPDLTVLEYDLSLIPDKTVNITARGDSIVDWGDGTSETNYQSLGSICVTYQHTYDTSKLDKETVLISIPGPLPLLSLKEQKKNRKILSLSQRQYEKFFSSQGLVNFIQLGNKNKATSFDSFFSYCSDLKTIGSIFEQAGIKVTNVNRMFKDCKSLESIPETLFKGQNNLTEFESTFEGCESLKTVPTNLFSDCTSAYTFRFTFANSGLTSVPSGLFDNTIASNVYAIFYDCKDLHNVPKDLLANSEKYGIKLEDQF